MKLMAKRQNFFCVMLLVTGACDRIANDYSPTAPPTLPAPAVVYIIPAEPPTATAEADATQAPAANIAEASVMLSSAAHQLRNGDWLRAISILNVPALTSLSASDQAWAQSLQALAQSKMGQHKDALEILLRIDTSAPPSQQTASLALQTGNEYLALGDAQQAAIYFSRYLEVKPAILASHVWEQLADIRAAADDQAGAAEAYGRAILADRAGPIDGLLIARAGATLAAGRPDEAAAIYDLAATTTNSDYTRAKADFLRGQLFAAIGSAEKAKSFYNHAIDNYPETASAYLALVALLDSGETVSNLQRGRVDYHNGQYQPAVDALSEYLRVTKEPNPEAAYLLARSNAQLDRIDDAEQILREMVAASAPSAERNKAWLELARIQMYERDNPLAAIQTYLDFVETGPPPTDGAAALASAARATAGNGNIGGAADIYLRIAAQYPNLPAAITANFQAGIALYRSNQLEAAQNAFSSAAADSTASPEQVASANLWMGKVHAMLGQPEMAASKWAAAALADPTSYYALRAIQLAAGSAPLPKSEAAPTQADLAAAQADFEQWLASHLKLASATGLRELAEPLRNDGRWLRGSALWHLGLETEARVELDSLRVAVRTNALAAYQLALAYRELGYYYGSIYAARDCVDALGFEQTPLAAPRFLTLLRFGPYFDELINDAAAKENLDPLLLAALIRQESLYLSSATSSASARGLMQIIPPTGDWIASKLAWPEYTVSDLNRPIISIPFGAFYLAEQRRNFDSKPYAMLAAYNAGPGNARRWLDLSGDDPDLFLEVITATETQRYIRRISEYRAVYAALYEPQ